MMLQIEPRHWPPVAVHDTMEAVIRGAAFRRSIQSSLGERLFEWLAEWMRRLVHFLGGTASARTLALALAALLVLLVVARLLLSARARNESSFGSARTNGARPSEDPWRAAERLVASAHFEEAAHALYRGVLLSIAHGERVRLHPSKTSGDYARELRTRGSASLASFRAFVRAFDAAVYGHRGCDGESLAELLHLALPFAPRARAA